MSDEHGFAPEPHRTDSGLPEYAAGDTGTRAVPTGAPDVEPEPTEHRAPEDAAPEDAAPEHGAPEHGAPEHGAPGHEDLIPFGERAPDHGEPAAAVRGGRRAAPRPQRGRRGFAGCLAVLVALVVVCAIVLVGGTKGYHYLKDHLGESAADYAGPGTGSVIFQVHKGDTAADMGRNLKSQGVVESVEAFIGAANADRRAAGIQVGFYKLKKQMKAADALDVLVDHKNLVQNTVLVREGVRTADVVTTVAEAAKASTAKVQQALDHLKLPASADGDPEGYLFPATYAFGPGTSAADMLAQMVSTWQKQADSIGLDDTTIDGHSYTAQQLLTVASLVQSEGKTPDDMAKIARVIYNRIEHPGAEGQAGMLQIDATVDYALHRPLTVGLTQDERESTDSPYNTFLHAGLPPGPIGNPGAAAMKAALHPADGDWYYYVTVNLATGETKFAHTYSEFQQYVAEHQHYCETESASGCR